MLIFPQFLISHILLCNIKETKEVIFTMSKDPKRPKINSNSIKGYNGHLVDFKWDRISQWAAYTLPFKNSTFFK